MAFGSVTQRISWCCRRKRHARQRTRMRLIKERTDPPSGLELEIGAKTRDPLLPLGATIVFEFEPFVAPDIGGTVLKRRV